MKKIAIFGAGGFGQEVACLINMINKQEAEWELVGFYDDGLTKGDSNKYGTILGGLKELNNFSEELNVVIAIANPIILNKLSNAITNPLVKFPNLIAPNTLFFDEETFVIGKGNIVFVGCRISTFVEMGDFNVLNGAISFGHHVKVGSYNSFGPSVRISGNCSIGDGNFFGVNAVVLQGNKIGTNTRIGVGAVVIRATKDNELYMGNPAVKVKY